MLEAIVWREELSEHRFVSLSFLLHTLLFLHFCHPAMLVILNSTHLYEEVIRSLKWLLDPIEFCNSVLNFFPLQNKENPSFFAVSSSSIPKRKKHTDSRLRVIMANKLQSKENEKLYVGILDELNPGMNWLVSENLLPNRYVALIFACLHC